MVLAGLATSCRPAPDSPAGGPAGRQPGADRGEAVSTDHDDNRFKGIGANEAISLVGTEPFWGGTVRERQFSYSTPENQAGETVAVTRFAGNNGLGFSGVRQGKPLDLAITPGACSDGMSERTYPYTATLRLGDEQRSGCAWTEREPFTGAARP